MTDTIATTLTALTGNLHLLADLLADNDLPFLPYVSSSYDGTITAHWFVQNHTDDLPEQKTMAAALVRALGGKWDKAEALTEGDYTFTQTTQGVSLIVTVERAAVCRRVVVGTHEVTVPATPAQSAEPERVETVEDVTWECGSLLAENDDALPVAS